MDFLARSIHWLLPEEAAPCDIFIYFRGKYVNSLSQGSPVSFALLEKIYKAKYLFIYIKKADEPAWETWVTSRNAPFNEGEQGQKSDKQSRVAAKRAEYLSYIQKTVNLKDQNDTALAEAWDSALFTIQTVVQHPMLNWYFQQFHEPADLFHHSARVVGMLSLFSTLQEILNPKETEDVILAALIHELQGDPSDQQNIVSGAATLDLIEQQKRSVPSQVLELIQKQDELCSGKGFPNNLKATAIPLPVKTFSFFNHYDHYRLKQSGTRRARHDAVKAIMEKRKEDFDPTLWPLFWKFIEQRVEIIT